MWISQRRKHHVFLHSSVHMLCAVLQLGVNFIPVLCVKYLDVVINYYKGFFFNEASWFVCFGNASKFVKYKHINRLSNSQVSYFIFSFPHSFYLIVIVTLEVNKTQQLQSGFCTWNFICGVYTIRNNISSDKQCLVLLDNPLLGLELFSLKERQKTNKRKNSSKLCL